MVWVTFCVLNAILRTPEVSAQAPALLADSNDAKARVEMVASMVEECESRLETLQGTYSWIDRDMLSGGSPKVTSHVKIEFIKAGRKVRCDKQTLIGVPPDSSMARQVDLFDGENYIDYAPNIRNAMYRTELGFDYSSLQFGVRAFPRQPLSDTLRRLATEAEEGEVLDVSVTGPKQIEGTEHYLVKYKYADTASPKEMLIDAERGLIRRTRHYDKRTDLETVSRLVSVVEVAPGVWLPKEVKRTFTEFAPSESGELVKEHVLERTCVAETLTANEPVPDDAFKIDFPPGTLVGSDITGKGFRVPEPEDMVSEELLVIEAADELAMEAGAEPERPAATPAPQPPQEPAPGEAATVSGAGKDGERWPLVALCSIVALGLIGTAVAFLRRRSAKRNGRGSDE